MSGLVEGEEAGREDGYTRHWGLGLEKDAAERRSLTRGKIRAGQEKAPRGAMRGAPGVKRG